MTLSNSLVNNMFCEDCGQKLEKKELEHEGLIPYCPNCKKFIFPKFSVAMSAIILSPDKKKTLLIKQYNTSFYRLVAGYVNKGESVEETVIREIKEEVNLDVISYKPLKTAYYEKTNTLMCNYLAVVKDENVTLNYEVQEYKWFDLDDAVEALKDAKLASKFYDYFMKNKG